MNIKVDRQLAEPSQNRLSTREPGGETLSLITGQEPLAELRKLIIEFSQACPFKQSHLACPFHIMGTLSNASLITLANSLSRESCLALFQMELDCRSQSNAPCQLPPPKRKNVNGAQSAALASQPQKPYEKPTNQTLRWW